MALKAVLFPPVEDEIRASFRTAQTTECAHGRIETRVATTLPTEHLNIAFHGAMQVVRVERTRLTVLSKHESRECAYFITSLTRARASAEHLLYATRGHWQIENGLHYVRDVTFGEDFCRVRSKGAPETLAALRNVSIWLAKKIDSNCAYAQRLCASKIEWTVNYIRTAVL